MNNYPYYIAVRYDAGVLYKCKFGVSNGKKFNTFSDCADAIKHMYNRLPITKDSQILILEYTAQYKSKIIEICCGDWWTSVAEPIKFK